MTVDAAEDADAPKRAEEDESEPRTEPLMASPAREGSGDEKGTGAPAPAAAPAAAGKARPLHLSFESQHVVYLLHNGRLWYTGETANTKGRGPWQLVAVAAAFPNRSVAQGFETTLKGKTGGASKRIEAMRKLAAEYSTPAAPITVHVGSNIADSDGES